MRSSRLGRTYSRRQVLAAGSRAAAGVLLGAAIRPARAANVNVSKGSGQVIVRALGGAYQDAELKAIFGPFTEATGIKVVTVPATAGQVKAMVESGSVQLDVLDLGELVTLNLSDNNYLEKIDYSAFRLTNPGDIQPHVRRETMVGNIYFATVLAYNTEIYKARNPRTWAEFWDLQRFPGPRTLPDQQSGGAPLEFAELADGIPMRHDRIYPVDLDRAFRSLSRVRPGVVKWWTTGAISAELLDRREAFLGALWNGRVQDLIDKGAPLAIEWNQAKRQLQFWSIVRGAPNKTNALRFLDFALQPRVQAGLTRYIAYGPTNKQALKYVRPEDARKLPSAPDHFANSFDEDARWWASNFDRVSEQWQTWLLKG